ncbi:MAG: citrate/2-methylcitrate synthase [candidate division WOR-3 bacterium]
MKDIKEIGEPVYSSGLENIYFSETKLSYIDGENGRLYYMGIPIEELANNSTFEETAYLMLYQKLPTLSELEEFTKKLKENRDIPEILLKEEELIPKNAHPMDVLRTIVSFVGMLDENAMSKKEDEIVEKSIKLTAILPTITAYFHRLRNNLEIVRPDPNLNHAGNFLYMLRGEKPSDIEIDIFDKTLILYIEHGMNASTFSAIITASTQSDIYSAIVSAIGTLKGPLHGGANEEAMKMLFEIDRNYNGDVEAYLKDKISKKERIMGFGHRVYKAYDPRARILKDLALKLADFTNNRKWVDMQIELEEKAGPILGEKKIYPNVDYYAASIYYMLGIPFDLYTSIFAIARVVGWCAHVLEYWKIGGRLLRPREKYVGELNIPYLNIEQRR